MPVVQTKGAMSSQGLGEFSSQSERLYVEDVFSTHLYTGNGSTQTITNEIDLAGKGGLVWIKARTNAASGDNNHELYDTARGVRKVLNSNQDSAENTFTSNGLTAFNANGFFVSDDSFGSYGVNGPSGRTFTSWTFRKAKKFFDIVTYTGDGTTSLRTLSHNLGSTPGMIITKNTSSTQDWVCWHRGLTSNNYLIFLNSTSAQTNAGIQVWDATDTTFSIHPGAAGNVNGETYVVYLFAHDTASDGVIQCGSFTTAGNVTVNLGWEPQYVLLKRASASSDWSIFDTMRGFLASPGDSNTLAANTSAAEAAGGGTLYPNATGFTYPTGTTGDTWIYIAIRRGPMRTPTSGTSVFSPLTYTGDGTSGRYISGAGFPPDLIIQTARSASENREWDDRLRGWGNTAANALFSNSTNAEAADSGSVQLLNQDGFTVRSFGNGSSVTYVGECLRRAPGFFDVACYSGASAIRTVSHNLGVAPELVIIKDRSAANNWIVGALPQTFANYGALSNTDEFFTDPSVWNSTAPTATVFTLGNNGMVNATGENYVAYLFASCPGVQYINSYVGDGTTGRTINCGFAGGARFVCIKATSTTGSWWIFDSARGIVAAADPALQLNSTAAEVTSADAIDAVATGFIVNQETTCNLNVNGETYLVWAIA